MYRIWTEEGITIMFVSSFLVDFGYTGNVKFPTSNSFQCEMEWGFIYGRSFLNPCSWNITCWNSCGLLYLLQRATWKPAFQKFYFHTIVATDKKYSFLKVWLCYRVSLIVFLLKDISIKSDSKRVLYGLLKFIML